MYKNNRLKQIRHMKLYMFRIVCLANISFFLWLIMNDKKLFKYNKHILIIRINGNAGTFNSPTIEIA